MCRSHRPNLFLFMSRHSRVAINGAAGRMGRQLLVAVAEHDDCTLGGALEKSGNPAVGTSIQLLAPESDSDTNTGTSADAASLVVDDISAAAPICRYQGSR